MIYKVTLELEGAEPGISGTVYNVDRNTWAVLRDALEGRIVLKVEQKDGNAGQDEEPAPDTQE